MAKEPDPAPAPKKAPSSALELQDILDRPIGTTVDLGPADPAADTDVRRAASRVRGWSDLVVDGQPYPYSPEACLNLFNRYPHFARQVLEAK